MLQVDDFYPKQARLLGYHLLDDIAVNRPAADLAILAELVATGRLAVDIATVTGIGKMPVVLRELSCIKLMASGGVLGSAHEQPGAPQLTMAELRAAIEEAHAAGCHVAAHAHSLLAINNAINAGANSIEHGSYLDSETARRMHEKRVFLVPTLSAVDAVCARAAVCSIAPEAASRAREVALHNQTGFRHAIRHNVRLAAGSDSGIPGQRHGALPDELIAMVRAGATPAAALRSATSDAAILLGIDDEVGSLAPGKRADLIAVQGDPTVDIGALRELSLVVLGGVEQAG